LCAKALTAQSPELEQIMNELREALHEHAAFVREMASQVLKQLPSDPMRDGKPKNAA